MADPLDQKTKTMIENMAAFAMIVPKRWREVRFDDQFLPSARYAIALGKPFCIIHPTDFKLDFLPNEILVKVEVTFAYENDFDVVTDNFQQWFEKRTGKPLQQMKLITKSGLNDE